MAPGSSAAPSKIAGAFPCFQSFFFLTRNCPCRCIPTTRRARQVGEPCGKTECWYVAQAKPGAQIALGLKSGTTRAQFEQSIYEQRAEELLNWINVFRGEMIYVAGGTVHTLGPGSIIVETQQQSDTTYRLYDYGRPRELHLQQGLKAMKEKVASGKVVRPAPSNMNGTKNRRSPLVASTCFVVDLFELKTRQEFTTQEPSGASSVQILVAIDGCGVIEAQASEPVTFAKGDAVVIPAGLGEFSVQPQWSLEVLKSYVPARELPEPETRM